MITERRDESRLYDWWAIAALSAQDEISRVQG